MKVLVTGFEPFNGAEINPSWEAVKCLPDKICDADIIGLPVPVEYGRGGQLILDAARKVQPALILATGLAAGRKAVTPELVALNWRMASIPDNAGISYGGVMIDPHGPAARMTTLPVTTMVEAVNAADIPCGLSLSAGAYVCNDVYWTLLEASEKSNCPTLFVHVPGQDVLTPEQTAKALEIIIQMALEQ